MITKESIEHMGSLIKLEFTEDEKTGLIKALGEILYYAKILDKLDTRAVQPMNHVLPLKNVYGSDEVIPSLDIEKVLKNAPDSFEGCFRVPRII